MMRSANGFILVIDLPYDDRDKVAEAFRKGEPPPTQLRLFATDEFQPSKKVAATLAVIARELYAKSGDLPTGPPTPSTNGKLLPLPQAVKHIAFGLEGDYGDQLHLLAVTEIVPPGEEPGQHANTTILCSIPFPHGTDFAKGQFAALETWAAEQVDEVARQVGWPKDEVAEMVQSSLVQLRKAWDMETDADV